LIYKNLLLIDEEKKTGKGIKWQKKNWIGELDLVYGFFWRKWTVTTNLDNDCFSNLICLSLIWEANDANQAG
jgi:hypothetical protein